MGGRRDAREAGAGVISTVAGVAVFLLLLLFAVQVLYGLYATTVVTAVTYDAAKEVAGSGGGEAARAEAQRRAAGELGRYGGEVSFDWRRSDEDAVRLTVRARRPSFLPRQLVGDSLLGDIVRTVRVRTEKVR
ncbi:MAG TPA: hypothetical protein VMZ73_00625 [Acidimicrobiales bacterium]|nr:hypothetical protein [Acidimicrobiales bacterium]